VTLYETSQELTFKWDNIMQIGFMQGVLELFVELWLKERLVHENVTGYDLALLQELAKLTRLEVGSAETWRKLQYRLGQMASRGLMTTLQAD